MPHSPNSRMFASPSDAIERHTQDTEPDKRTIMGLWFSSKKMDTEIQVQIQDKAVCIS